VTHTGETTASKPSKNVTSLIGSKPAILQSMSYADIRQTQLNDRGIKPILEWRENSEQAPAWNEVQTFGEDTRILWGQFDSLIIENGVLYRKFYNADDTIKNLQLLLPENLREAFVSQLHSGVAQDISH